MIKILLNTEPNIEFKTEFMAENKVEQKTEHKTGNKTEHKTGNKIEHKTGNKIGSIIEHKIGNKTGNIFEHKIDYKTEHKIERKIEHKIEHKTKHKMKYKIEANTDIKNDLKTRLKNRPTIMIFTEGTIIKPRSWLSLYHHNSYIPIGNAVNIITAWQQSGANIIYCTSRKRQQAQKIASLLKKLGFQGTYLVAREQKESYKDIVEELLPDILIEDDCKSIGGAWQMCITKVDPIIKSKIVAIAVPEFKGIDGLPLDLEKLKLFQS